MQIFETFHDAYIAMLMELHMAPDFVGNDGYRECHGMSFRVTLPVLHNKVTTPLAGVDYEYAASFAEYILSGDDFLGYAHKLIATHPRAAKFLDTEGLPAGYTAAYPPKIARQWPALLVQLKAELAGEQGAGGAGRRAVLHILEDVDKVRLAVNTQHEYPCTLAIQFMIRQNHLHMVVNMRSNHVPRILCYDFFCLSHLMETLWRQLQDVRDDLNLGSYTHIMNSGHMFARDAGIVHSILLQASEIAD